MANDPDTSQVDEDPAIDSLEARIAKARAEEDRRTGKDKELMGQVHASAMSVASTMVGYPLGGIIIGWFLDQLFGTLPWLTITMMFLAFIGACIHVVRMNSNKSADAED
ncbi:AtpZ/AtpI family protein [Altererythrobacter sp. MF3-039]|uniref:AtpZ/AtpI family protein n=1 Tax=Altererythrobacter sp. MF3-039 TaxID=3252901 RepID=UPI00390C8030